MERSANADQTLSSRLWKVFRQPRIVLFLLAAWCFLALATQLFVNSGLFLDTHNVELDGALGGLALSFNAAPLALLYLYCARDPGQYFRVFWLSLLHQGAMMAGNLYEWAIGTFSFESILIPLIGATFLAVLSFLQVFEPAGRKA